MIFAVVFFLNLADVLAHGDFWNRTPDCYHSARGLSFKNS